MNPNQNTQTDQITPAEPIYSFRPFAQLRGKGEENPDPNTICRCKNCGRRIRLREAANFYGVPACPICLSAGAPFEMVRDTA